MNAPSHLTSWRTGDRVAVRGGRWTIVESEAWPDCTSLRLASADEGPPTLRTLLSPFDRPQRLERRTCPKIVKVRRWLHHLRRIGVNQQPFGGLRTVACTDIRLIAHQLEPGLAMLRHGATRVLVADGVGLGKTIQAGIVLSELSTEREMFRAIVLMPAGLRDQWTRELASHFHLAAVSADASWLRRTTAERPPDINPWSLPGIYVSSLDFVKQPEVLRPLEDVSWDLVVVDEAHTASTGTDRRAAADAIATRSRRVLLLTATPHGDDPTQFDALCRIGQLDESEGPICLFRRSQADFATRVTLERRSLFLPVNLSSAERRMHELLDKYTRRIWIEAGARNDGHAKLASIVLRKRALSSAASLAASARKRMDLLSGIMQPVVQHRLPFADEDPLDDQEPASILAAPGLADPRRERRWLSSIVETAQHAARDESKTRYLLRFLARIREPAIIFTEYRDTLTRLARAIAGTGCRIALLHGGLTPGERSRVQQLFNRGGSVLLATDAAAEGLNLHHHCRLVIHYELPWSLSRIEQRAGRVDRLGQTKRVHELALVATDSAERLVIAPLAARAARARASGHAGSLLDAMTESRVADLVMSGGSSAEPVGRQADRAALRSAVSTSLADESSVEVLRVQQQRQWWGSSPAEQSSSEDLLVSSLLRHGSSLPQGILFVYVLMVSDADGRRVHSEPSVLHIKRKIVHPTPKTPADLRRVLDELPQAARRELTSTLEEIGRTALEATRLALARHHASLKVREELMLRAQPSAARQLVQAGLFDRRELRQASKQELIVIKSRADTEARLQSFLRREDLSVATELRAALVIGTAAARSIRCPTLSRGPTPERTTNTAAMRRSVVRREKLRPTPFGLSGW